MSRLFWVGEGLKCCLIRFCWVLLVDVISKYYIFCNNNFRFKTASKYIKLPFCYLKHTKCSICPDLWWRTDGNRMTTSRIIRFFSNRLSKIMRKSRILPLKIFISRRMECEDNMKSGSIETKLYQILDEIKLEMKWK